MSLNFGSVCSGIEAASVAWEPLGWRASFLSEIEKFPRAVLSDRFPAVPLHGDFTTIREGEYEPIDLLVGGTPCQSFSVAGLRGGLGDDRGNLALEYLRLAARLKPRWIVFENVPGIISDKTEALTCLLDGMEDLGYIIDIDILDAQFFGVPQRRRRVFICGQHRDDLITQMTDSSALTIGQCLQEILLGILVDQSPEFASGLENLASASLTGDGAKKRMKLFGLVEGNANFEMLLKNLVAALQRSAVEQNASVATLGELEKGRTQDALLTGSETEAPFLLTDRSLSESLGEGFALMKSFITLTTTNSTTQKTIYSCSIAALHIAKLTLALNQSSPSFWTAASSSLIALKGYINYARSAGSDLFAGVEWFRAWGDFLREADALHDAFERLGIGSFGEVFSISESLRGDSPPRREARKVAPTIPARSSGGGGLGTDGGLIASTGDVSHCLNAGGMGRIDYETETLIAHALRGEGFDAGEDGTGRGTPLVPVSVDLQNCRIGGDVAGTLDTTRPSRGGGQAVAFSCKDHGADAGDLAPTPRAMGHGASHPNAGGQIAVASRAAVRRLTPRECERLQGFPDVRKDVTILVCSSDRQKNYVLAEIKNHKLPLSALNAEGAPSKPNANHAGENFSINLADQDWPVALNVRIDFERSAVEISSLGRLLWSASNAAEANWFHPCMRCADFVHIAALMMQIPGRPIQTGEAASPRKSGLSTHPWNGSEFVPVSGPEIGALVKDAQRFTSAANRFMKSTTSEVGPNFQNYERTLETWSSCVAAAINGFIPEQIRATSSYALRIEGVEGFTAITYRGKPAADGPRYKAIGNSMAVPVMRWIGERIAMVDRL